MSAYRPLSMVRRKMSDRFVRNLLFRFVWWPDKVSLQVSYRPDDCISSAGPGGDKYVIGH